MGSKKMEKLLFFLTFLISVIAVLSSLIFLMNLLISGNIANTNIIVVIALIFDPCVILILNYIVYTKNYKYSPLKQPDEVKEKIIIGFIWAISIVVLLTIVLTILQIWVSRKIKSHLIFFYSLEEKNIKTIEKRSSRFRKSKKEKRVFYISYSW